MSLKKFGAVAVAALAAALLTSSSQAATVLKSGDTAGGWKISFPSSAAGGISLISDGVNGTVLGLEKGAAFLGTEGLVITFTQLDSNASPTISIVNESITNLSGKAFGGFQFLLADTLVGGGSPSAFTSSFNLVAPSDEKFTSSTFGSNTITLGGTLADGDTSLLGFDSAHPGSGDLTFSAGPAASGTKKVFNLKEQPLPPTGIPLPAAAWSGLTGLVGLGLVSVGKKARKLLA